MPQPGDAVEDLDFFAAAGFDEPLGSPDQPGRQPLGIASGCEDGGVGEDDDKGEAGAVDETGDPAQGRAAISCF